MNPLQAIRSWQKRSALRTCLVLIAVWLNVAFQACAMASMPAEDCPHCPAGMHGSEMPSGPMDCALLDSMDDPDLISPVVKVPGVSGDFAFIASGGWAESIGRSVAPVRLPPVEFFLPFHGPPPYVLFCVYLN